MSSQEKVLSKLGFYLGNSGAHAGRSLMLQDLGILLDAMAGPMTRDACRAAIVEQNLFAKTTLNNRVHAAKRMAQLYGLDDSICLFRNFRRLWSSDPASRPTLAVLLALARDGLLRASSGGVLEAPIGAVVDPASIASAVDRHSAGRMGAATIRHTVGNILHSWEAAGYLSSSTPRVRVRASAVGPGSVAFALFLGWLEGARGENLFRTSWTLVLDRTVPECVDLASTAAKRGMLEFLNAGGVMELRFPGYLTPEEEAFA